jgi:hypothetical protein
MRLFPGAGTARPRLSGHRFHRSRARCPRGSLPPPALRRYLPRHPQIRRPAEEFFVKEGYQPAPVARSEAKRGTAAATYGYYTMGKLMILKLRDDYKAKVGAEYSLQKFHDAFIKLGPLPLPLIRKAMLGEVGQLF